MVEDKIVKQQKFSERIGIRVTSSTRKMAEQVAETTGRSISDTFREAFITQFELENV